MTTNYLNLILLGSALATNYGKPFVTEQDGKYYSVREVAIVKMNRLGVNEGTRRKPVITELLSVGRPVTNYVEITETTLDAALQQKVQSAKSKVQSSKPADPVQSSKLKGQSSKTNLVAPPGPSGSTNLDQKTP